MIDFALVTLDGTKSKQDVFEIIVPTPQGYIAVMPHHVPLVSLVSTGVVSVRKNQSDRDEQLDVYAVSGGVIEIEDNYVRILVNEADQSDEVNEEAARKAHEEALAILANTTEKHELARAQAKVNQEAARLHVAKLRRRKRTPKV